MIPVGRKGDEPVLQAAGDDGRIILGGCNMVMTDKPMFSVADGAGAPAIRGGVWRDDKPDCVFDEAAPQNKWPKCADAEPRRRSAILAGGGG